MQHADTKPLLAGLPGQRFLDAHLILSGRWATARQRIPVAYVYEVFEECPISFGVTSPRRCLQVDAMIHISFGPGGIVYLDDQIISVEIKQTRKDLYSYDATKYNCVADFYYLAVTPDLLQAALRKAAANPTMGVFDITTGKIHRMATYTGIDDRTRINLQVMMTHYATRMPPAIRRYLLGPSLGFNKSKTEDADKPIMAKCYALRQKVRDACAGKEDPAKLEMFDSILREELDGL